MVTNGRAGTGLRGVDQALDSLRLGDNVVWQVDSMEEYIAVVQPFVAQARQDGRRILYVRFGEHPALLNESDGVRVVPLDASEGFERFAADVHNLVKEEGQRAFYVFDCLSDLLRHWYSDLMIGNFFKVTCPYLYELDTVAYFALLRGRHTDSTVAGIRETTQLLLDLYRVNEKLVLHPLKVWQRYSPTMFFPHRIQGQEAVCITASAEVAELFSTLRRSSERRNHWHRQFDVAREALALPEEGQQEIRRVLLRMLVGHETRMFTLCDRYFSLQDILDISDREVGTGQIGGKSVGMLLARRILEKEGDGDLTGRMEWHDSYYLGTDVFYTYVVENGAWRLRIRQKTDEGYFRYAEELREKLLNGRFPADIREQFLQMLEYYGQSPIIVRSSSLLEDGFGNAFAGKYESVFCANQGTPEERYAAFEQAIRTVYASTMSPDALAYRRERGLLDRDEQMAILVQRVSGDQYGEHFFPHLAGVGHSFNLFVWDRDMDADAGMLRLVFGLGTRAVDRTEGDHVRVVCLDQPTRLPPMSAGDEARYSQHQADVLSLPENRLTTLGVQELLDGDVRVDTRLFARPDFSADAGRGTRSHSGPRQYILDFKRLLDQTAFPGVMRQMLSVLGRVYECPVDVEFTANFLDDEEFRVNLVQCRPLQTRGLGRPVPMPDWDPGTGLFRAGGEFMGGNVQLKLNHVVYVRSGPYLRLSEREKHDVARKIGRINQVLRDRDTMLVGPGRWGTTTPSLGVPVHFSEMSRMAVICEVASEEEGFVPELSFGSHFFQDLVESDMFYVALFTGRPSVAFFPERITDRPNRLVELCPEAEAYTGVIHVADLPGLEVYSDVAAQRVLCRLPEAGSVCV